MAPEPMFSEDTLTNLRAIARQIPKQKRSPVVRWIKDWSSIALVALGVGAAAYKMIAWPWQTKDDADKSYARLENKIDKLAEKSEEREKVFVDVANWTHDIWEANGLSKSRARGSVK